MHLRSSRASRALLVIAAVAIAACSDRPGQTQPAPTDPNRLIACGEGCGGGGGGGGGSPPPPPPIAISSISLPDNTLPVDGDSRPYTATLTNNGAAVSGAVLQGWIVQGSTRRAANGVQVDCHAGLGVLPNGSCQVNWTAAASTHTSGSGAFLTGIGTLELDLTAGSFTTTRTIGVNLIPGDFSAGGLSVWSLSGAIGTVGVGTYNPGPQSVSSLDYRGTVIQGSAQRVVIGGFPLACGPETGWGNLPPGISCSQTLYPSVTNSVPGPGTLVPGPATFQVQFTHGGTVLNTRTWTITIIDARITAASASPNPIMISGAAQPFSVTLTNNGPAIPGVAIYATIRQGPTTRGGPGALLGCGAAPNTLPTGTCTLTGKDSAAGFSAGDGQLVPGPALLAIVARTYNNGSSGVLDSTLVPVTLVGPPTFGTITPSGDAVIGSSVVNYTATLNNPGATIADASVKVRIIQGSTNREANSGPDPVNCGSGLGTIPAGACTFTSIYFATNLGVGTGQLVPGTATLQITLSDPLNGTLATASVPITLLAQ